MELLRGSQLTPFQEEMSLSVDLAGKTLLDTVDHILDYSKISNLTRHQKKYRARVATPLKEPAQVEEDGKDTTMVDLARVTEDVVESVVSAHRFSRSFERDGSKVNFQDQESVAVILDIEKRRSWATNMTPGSWTRVLTNIGKQYLSLPACALK